MALQFARAKPLQALKLSAVIILTVFGIAGFIGLLPRRGLDAFLLLAFVPMLLAAVVAGEALLAAYRLARADEAAGRLTSRPIYTAVRMIEVLLTVGAPATFYLLIVTVGQEVAGPGAIGLLLIGVALGLLALGGVLLRTLVEYVSHRRNRAPPIHADRNHDVIE